MDATTIVERLRQRFPAGVVSAAADTADATVVVDRSALVEIATFLRDTAELDFDFLESIAGVDLGEKLLCVYHLLSYQHRHALVLKVELLPDDLAIPSLAAVWPAANWHEREQYDLFGFAFTGHPDLRRIMLPEDWVGHPLRKSYRDPEEYHGIRHDRPSVLAQLQARDARDFPRTPPPAATTPATPTES